MPAIVQGGGGAGISGTPTDYDYRLYRKVVDVYKRAYLPPIYALSFELNERGGMGPGSFELTDEWDGVSLNGTEFLDVYLFGILIYRGFLFIPSRSLDVVETHSAELQSVSALLNRYLVRWPYAYGGGADLAVIAEDVLSDFVSLPSDRLGAYLGTDLDTTGITLTEFDATDRTVAQAFNMLCDKGPGQVIWGVEPSWDTGPPGTPLHRVYLRPRPTATGKYYSIGGNVSAFTYPQDTGAIVNVLNVTGGPVAQPNLVYNASFEEVAPASETVGNLLADYSFEDNDAAWTLTGSRKYTGLDATAMGSPKSGKHWLELDNSGESGIQTVLAPFSVIYTGIMWARQEEAGGGNAREVKLTLDGLDSGNNVVVTANTNFVTPPDSGVWTKYTVDLDPTGAATVVKIRFTVETNGGSASNDGVLVDDCALIEKNGEGAVGWRRRVVGAANASTFQWNYRPTSLAYHGGYAVRSDPSAIAGAGDYVEIRTAKSHRISVPPNERLSLLVFLDPGASAADYSIGIIEYTSAGTETTTSESATLTTSGTGLPWEEGGPLTISASTDGPGITTRADTAFVEVFLRHRDNDELLVDAFFLCVGEMPSDVRISGNGDYWPGETYERRIKTSDALFTGGLALDAAADASIATYGEREDSVTNAFITDRASLLEFAQDYFNANAVPVITAILQVNGLMRASELLDCADDRVQVSNLPEAPDALNPVSVNYTAQNDSINFSANLGNERPTLAGLLRYVQGREAGRGL